MPASSQNLNEFIDMIPVLKESVRFMEEPQGAVLKNEAKENYGRYLLTSSFEASIISKSTVL